MSSRDDVSLPRRLTSAIAAMRSQDDGKEVQVSGARPICGAIGKRSGKPCQVRILGRGGRCYLHGGASTGPKTQAGREQSRRNAKALNEQRARERAMAEQEQQRLADGERERQQEQDERRRIEIPPTRAPELHAETYAWRWASLQDELQAVMKRVGPQQYAYATAREFAIGKYSRRSVRPRRARM